MLSRKTPLRRHTPLRPRNVKRQRERFACCFDVGLAARGVA